MIIPLPQTGQGCPTNESGVLFREEIGVATGDGDTSVFASFDSPASEFFFFLFRRRTYFPFTFFRFLLCLLFGLGSYRILNSDTTIGIIRKYTHYNFRNHLFQFFKKLASIVCFLFYLTQLLFPKYPSTPLISKVLRGLAAPILLLSV